MDDRYLECVVPKRTSFKERQMTILFLGGAVMFFLSGLVGVLPAAIPAFVLGILGWQRWQKLKAEYDYTLVGGELNVDVIYRGKRRKKLLHCQLKNAVAMVASDDETMVRWYERGIKIKDYSSGEPEDTHWTLIFKPEEDYIGFLLTPDEGMVKEIRLALRREGIVC